MGSTGQFLFPCSLLFLSVSWGCHQLGDSKQQKCILYQLQRPKVWNPGVINKVASFLEAVRDSLGCAFFPGVWWCLAILDVPWPVDISLQSLSPSPHGSLPLSVSTFLSSYQNSSHWVRAHLSLVWGFPGGSVVESACQCRIHDFDPWVGKIPWRRKW